jgi:hypothetical protein
MRVHSHRYHCHESISHSQIDNLPYIYVCVVLKQFMALLSVYLKEYICSVILTFSFFRTSWALPERIDHSEP